MIPPLPPARGPGQDGGTASILPRYEDITQDGRIQLLTMMPGIGAAVWRALLAHLPALDVLKQQGILPILHRLVAVGEDRSVSVNVPIQYTGSFRFARQRGGDRLFANMWLEARAPIASTHGPRAPKDAPLELVGRIFAEHVLTKPFAPPGERRVSEIDAPGVPRVPEDEHEFEDSAALLATAVTEGGGPLEDAGDFVFGMMHTDSNQHVNSLVYPRIFEEAVVRRLARDGGGGAGAGLPSGQGLLARAIELRWRRPFFAGERVTMGLRFLEAAAASAGSGGVSAKLGAIGSFTPAGPGTEGAKPSAAVKLLFR